MFKKSITSFFENEFEYANELYTIQIWPKYTQSNFFCIVSSFWNELEYLNELQTYWICCI